MYYVQEYMHNGDLYTALANDKLSDLMSWYNKGREIALHIARGISYLHSNKIVHLDIKVSLYSKGGCLQMHLLYSSIRPNRNALHTDATL